MANSTAPITSSFRDPNGFVFLNDGTVYRQINIDYQFHYDLLMKSGLYKKLTEEGLLISHEEVFVDNKNTQKVYKVIKPKVIPFISYPYEWSFSQLKDAALTTLKIQKTALDFDMSLKDCSAYNIQFVNGKPVLIDTLSFEKYPKGQPWVAYKQFCQHFLAPLALMAYNHINLNQLSRLFIDGIPLDVASAILPLRTRFNFGLLCHIHSHAKFQGRYADRAVQRESLSRQFNRNQMLAFIDSLETQIGKFRWIPKGTEWAEYYGGDNNYAQESLEDKKRIVLAFIEKIRPENLWDLGANTGLFSRLASSRGIPTVAFDIDPACVEQNYLKIVKQNEANLLALTLDLTNPSPAIGWNLKERMSTFERGPAHTIMALALIHHLVISNNVPLETLAVFFRNHSRFLIIEFIPKEDSQIQKLLATREDIFTDYTQENFEKAFGRLFTIKSIETIKNSGRVLYLMEGKE